MKVAPCRPLHVHDQNLAGICFLQVSLMSLYLARCTTLSLNEIDASHYRIKWHWPYLLCNKIAWRCVVAGLEVHPVAHHLCTFSNNISICVFVSSFWHIHPSEASCTFSFFPCLFLCFVNLFVFMVIGGGIMLPEKTLLHRKRPRLVSNVCVFMAQLCI